MSRNRHTNNINTETFICSHCGGAVVPVKSGSRQRNHCQTCLYSLHVDLGKGGRRCGCRGEMEPIGVWVKPSGEWALIRRCAKCGFIRTNRIAADDNEVLLFTLAAKPLMMLPFPAEKTLEKIGE
ncbi:MAG: RNHCP domain-containing protein [Spirochaetales bacterium]|uniref:RNHCP domain-containing protein n=1 Tax=Candidatus Thalassospirochaeta sargassi TaxID=3119039 RepID=A0AAJ1MHL5_9SPIO|nr:RNHCP domain-containing protein [Spirochaetales bacterium]